MFLVLDKINRKLSPALQAFSIKSKGSKIYIFLEIFLMGHFSEGRFSWGLFFEWEVYHFRFGKVQQTKS